MPARDRGARPPFGEHTRPGPEALSPPPGHRARWWRRNAIDARPRLAIRRRELHIEFHRDAPALRRDASEGNAAEIAPPRRSSIVQDEVVGGITVLFSRFRVPRIDGLHLLRLACRASLPSVPARACTTAAQHEGSRSLQIRVVWLLAGSGPRDAGSRRRRHAFVNIWSKERSLIDKAIYRLRVTDVVA